MNKLTKTYLFAKLYGASDRTAKRLTEQYAKDRGLTRRHVGRGIRKAQRFLKTWGSYRPYPEQSRLYKLWKSKKPTVVPGTSLHYVGRALDVH